MNLKKIRKMAFALILLLSIILMMVPKTSTGYSKSINEKILDERGVGNYIDIDPMDYGETDAGKHTILHEDRWYCIEPDSILNSTDTSYKISSKYNIENTKAAYIVNQKSTLYGTGTSAIRRDTQVAYWYALGWSKDKLKAEVPSWKSSSASLQKELDKSFNSATNIYNNAGEWLSNIKNVKDVTISANTQVEKATITLNNFTSNNILGIHDKVYVDNVEKTSEVTDGKLTITRPSTRK